MNEQGFSLVELAIAITIIGFLTVAVLKGQVLIESSRVDAAIKTSQELSAAVKEFKKRYKLLPGDMPNPHIDNVIASCNMGGNGDGQIDATESACVPEVLTKAGLIQTNSTEAGFPVVRTFWGAVNVFSVGFSQTVAIRAANPFRPNVQLVVELSDLSCEAAISIDRLIDNDSFVDGTVAASVLTCTQSTLNDPVSALAISF